MIVLTVDLVGPAEASKAREAPIDNLLLRVQHTISRHLSGDAFWYEEILLHSLPSRDDLEEFWDEESNL